MKKMYTISDIATMSRLTERTIRNYMQMGILEGEKIDGIWHFTAEAVGKLFENDYVAAAIKAKDSALVFDFLVNTRKKEEEMCVILDIPKATDPRSISDFFCHTVSEDGYTGINFAYKQNGENVRVLLKGGAEIVMQILNSYYQM